MSISFVGSPVGAGIRVIHKVTLSSPSLWAAFHPLLPSCSGICKVKKFIHMQHNYELMSNHTQKDELNKAIKYLKYPQKNVFII
jgi:hypothetical protein